MSGRSACCSYWRVLAARCLSPAACIGRRWNRLLEEGDYVRPRKRQNGVVGAVSGIYWLVAAAAYLLWTFGPWWDAQPQDTWILWAVAGVLYGAVMALVRLLRK